MAFSGVSGQIECGVNYSSFVVTDLRAAIDSCLRRNMLKCLATILTSFAFSLPLAAQKDTAPNGYYQNSDSGATFTGFLQPENSDPQEITLVYTKGSKSDRFVGR